MGGWRCERILFDPLVQSEAEAIAIAPISVDLWYPADADAVVEHQIQTENEADPFWCYLWPTSRILAQQVFMTMQSTSIGAPPEPSVPLRPSSFTVLDTGCGIGLVGLAALAAGAKTVTFQDLRARSVDLALHNAQANGFGDRALGEPWDWRSPPAQTFDWIIASDVLYHAPAHAPLLTFLEGAIASPKTETSPNTVATSTRRSLYEWPLNGSIWIGDPGRRDAESFIKLAQSRFQIYLFDDKGCPLSVPSRGTYQLIILHPR